MDRLLFSAGGLPVTLAHALFAAVALLLLLLTIATVALIRGSRARTRVAEEALKRHANSTSGWASSHATAASLPAACRPLPRRWDRGKRIWRGWSVSGSMRSGRASARGWRARRARPAITLAKLNERLAVIDAAQAKLTGLTQEVVGLKDILANKQARGAFGQGRMEAIVKDGLPPSAYEFQYTLSNRNRPDCIIRLPGDDRVLVIDAKFPLEAFSALKAADSDELRKQALARVRNDIGKHVRDICERYFVPGETQDLAVLFVPSESVYADLAEHFDDLVQKAHRARVIIVSPSLLMMAIQVLQALVRDARVRDQAHPSRRKCSCLSTTSAAYARA